MVAIGAGVGNDAHLNGGERPVLLGAELHMRGHLVARGGADELLGAGEFPHYRPAGLQRGQRAQILRDHLLLAAEAAADALGEDMHVAVVESEQIAKFLLGDERRLRAGAHMQAPIVAAPGERAVRLQMHVLRARGRIGHLVDGVGVLEALLDAAELAVNVDIDIVEKSDALLLVQDGRARLHGHFRIEHGRQQLVLDLEQPAGRFRRAFGFGHHRGDPLPDEAHDIVEHVGVVGIDQVIFMRRRRVEFARHVLPGEDRDDAGHGLRLVALDRLDARMGMRRAQQFQVQRAVHWRDVERVMRIAGDDRVREGAAQARPARLSRHVLLGIDHAM